MHACSVASVVFNSVIPWTIPCQAPLSMGFSQKEYWSGLPCPPLGELPNPGIEPRSPTLQADSSLTEPPRKLRETEMGTLSLLQGIFLTQGLNPGLPHCRQTLYHLSHQGSPGSCFRCQEQTSEQNKISLSWSLYSSFGREEISIHNSSEGDHCSGRKIKLE